MIGIVEMLRKEQNFNLLLLLLLRKSQFLRRVRTPREVL
jgi:hypothetical protein